MNMKQAIFVKERSGGAVRIVKKYLCRIQEPIFESDLNAAKKFSDIEDFALELQERPGSNCIDPFDAILQRAIAPLYDGTKLNLFSLKVLEKELQTIKDIKNLALKIKNKIPHEWNEKFIEV